MFDVNRVALVLWLAALVFLILFLAVMLGPLWDDWMQRRRRARRGGMLR